MKNHSVDTRAHFHAYERRIREYKSVIASPIGKGAH